MKRPVIVLDRIHDDAGPETGAVLAHTPTFRLVAPLAVSLLQGYPGQTSLNVFGCVKAGKVLTDDLVGGVALDARGTGVPVGDVSVGIQHEDRIVRDALDKQPEAALGLQRGTLLGHVAGDFGEADEVAVAEDGIDDDSGPKTAPVFANAPGFRHEATGFGGDLQCLLRNSLGAVLLGVEAREVLADDFAFAITLDALRARIPTYDMPGGIQHVDGVVHDAANQQLIKVSANGQIGSRA